MMSMMPPDQLACALAIGGETLSAWRDAMLPRAETERLAGHVPSCAACQARLHAFDEVARALLAQRELEPGDRVVAEVRRRALGRTHPAQAARRRFWSGLGALASTAALILLFIYVFGPALGNHPPTHRLGVAEIHLADPSYNILTALDAPDGSLWFTEERFLQSNGQNGYTDGPSKIGHISPAGKLAEYPLPSGNSFGPYATAQTEALALGEDGSLWFDEIQGDLTHTAPPRTAIAKIDPSGAISEYPLPFARSIFFNPSVATPFVRGPDGNLWCAITVATHLGTTPADTTTSLVLARITSADSISAVPLAHLPTSSIFNGLVLGPDGNFWTILQQFDSNGAATSNAIARITLAGDITTFAPPSPAASLIDLFAGPDRNLWFVEDNTASGPSVPSAIVRMTPAGQMSPYALPGSFDLVALAGPDGNVWFSLLTSTCVYSGSCPNSPGVIGRITPTGTVTQYPLPTRNAFLASFGPGPDGNLYFVEAVIHGNHPATGNDTLGRITPLGQITEFTVPTHSAEAFWLVPGKGQALWLTESPLAGQPGSSLILRITLPES